MFLHVSAFALVLYCKTILNLALVSVTTLLYTICVFCIISFYIKLVNILNECFKKTDLVYSVAALLTHLLKAQFLCLTHSTKRFISPNVSINIVSR